MISYLLNCNICVYPYDTKVVLDVNRSLKRFPPGIPYARRVALQDQLTVLILRVIMRYPHLKYYQVSPRPPRASNPLAS